MRRIMVWKWARRVIKWPRMTENVLFARLIAAEEHNSS